MDEDCVAESLAKAASLPYLKIDPLQLDSDLISKTRSRPFVQRHLAVPLRREEERLLVAITDPFDSLLAPSIHSNSRGFKWSRGPARSRQLFASSGPSAIE